MATFAEGLPVDWHGIRIAGRGLEGELGWDVGAVDRSGRTRIDQVVTSIASNPGLEIVAEAGLTRLEITAPGTRGGGNPDAALVVDLGRQDPGRASVLLIEEDGEYSWAVPSAASRVV